MANKEESRILDAVIRLKSGDQHAFEDLYGLTRDRVYFLALKVVHNHNDALEVVQETYLSVYKYIGKLYSPEAFHGWLSKIVINKCYDFLGRQKDVLRNDGSEPEEEDFSAGVEDDSGEFIPHEVLDRDETRNMIMALIDSLPNAQRTTVLLHYYQELGVEEIAAIMECPVATVKSRLIYARRQIKTGVDSYETQGVKLYNIAIAPLLPHVLAGASKGCALTQATAAGIFASVSQSVHGAASVGATTAHTAATGASKLNLFAKLAAASVKAKIAAGVAAAAIVATAVAAPVMISASHSRESISLPSHVHASTSQPSRSPTASSGSLMQLFSQAPKVTTFYTLNNAFTDANGGNCTVNVALPNVDSSEPGASDYNAVFVKLCKEYGGMSSAGSYPGGLEQVGYKPFVYGGVMTIAISDSHWGEMNTDVSIYSYDYTGDKVLNSTELYQRFGLDKDALLKKLTGYVIQKSSAASGLEDGYSLEGVFQDDSGDLVVILNYGDDYYQEAYIYDKNRDTFLSTDILHSGFIFAPSDNKPATSASASPTPAASKWETAYAPVLAQYREFAEKFSQGGNNADFSSWDDPWDVIAPDYSYSSKKAGYALRDIDSNGTPELFLMTDDGSIWEMYTLVDGVPKLLGVYAARNACYLNQTNEIYTAWSDGAADWGKDAYRMSADGRALEFVERVGEESMDNNGNLLDQERYYICVGSEKNKKIISKQEAEAEWAKFPKSNDNSGLKFIPIMQDQASASPAPQ